MQIQKQSSYRCRVLRGPYDISAPEANTEVIGVKAASPSTAALNVQMVTGAHVLEVWRQDQDKHVPLGNIFDLADGDDDGDFVRPKWLPMAVA